MAPFIFYLYSKNANEQFYFSSEEESFMSQLEELINKLPKIEGTNIYALLCNIQTLRDELIIFEKLHEGMEPRVRRIMTFVNKLSEGEYFFYLAERAPLINHLCSINELLVLPDMRKRNAIHEIVLRKYGLLFTTFECYGFGFNGIKMSVGDYKTHPCRFCERYYPEVSFKKLAHAIPDALGNDLLFCNEECGKCNGDLAPIEANLTDFLDFNRVVSGIKTKKGEIPEVEGENFVIRRKGDGYGIYAKGTESFEDFMKNGMRLNHRKTITNTGIYKALTKMVIDLVPSEKIPHFRETVRWIKGDVTSRELPSIYWRYSEPTNQPALFLFVDEQNRPETPYCTSVLFVCNMVFMYVIPFVDIDRGQYKRDVKLQSHWPIFLKTFGGEWNQWNLSDDTPAKPFIELVAKDDTAFTPSESSEPLSPDIFEIHHRPTKREYVEFPDIDINKLFKALPSFEKMLFKVDNPVTAPLQDHTELSFGMGCNIVILYDEGKCETYTDVSISNSENTVKYVTMQWKCSFEFHDITTNIKLEENHFSFDYKLRDIIWGHSLFLGERNFMQELASTDFSQTKLTFLYDEHQTHFINYILLKDGKTVLQCNDKDLHR